MSHVTLQEADSADQQIRDIPALKRAVERCGLEFRENQTHFRTWATDHGRLVGDWPVPQGYTAADVKAGQCAHAIGLPGSAGKTGTEAYEIGVVPSKKYPGTFALMYDFFGGAIDKLASTGKGRNDKNRLDKLQMFYQVEACRTVAQQQRRTFVETVEADGSITVRAKRVQTF